MNVYELMFSVPIKYCLIKSINLVINFKTEITIPLSYLKSQFKYNGVF